MKKFLHTTIKDFLNEKVKLSQKEELAKEGFVYPKIVIHEDMILYHFAKSPNLEKNKEISSFSKIDKGYILNADFEYIIKIKADVKAILPFDSHNYVDEYDRIFLNIKYIIEKGGNSINKKDLRYLHEVVENIEDKDHGKDPRLLRIFSRNIIDYAYPYNECISINNRILDIYEKTDIDALLMDLKNNKSLVKSNYDTVFLKQHTKK